MKKTTLIIISIHCLIGFIAFALLSVFIRGDLDNQDENTTAHIAATVSETPITDHGDHLSVSIITREYRSELIILYLDTYPNNVIDDIRQLSKGEKIYFRIKSNEVEDMNSAYIMPIMSLETETETIFSLEDYNRVTEWNTRSIKYAPVFATLVLLAVSVLCLVSAIKKQA